MHIDDIFQPHPDREIRSSRIVSASQRLVFSAWTDPEHLKNWWGPDGFTNTFHVFDPRPGGTWKFTMHGPDKGHYENECVFLHISPPHSIAWDRVSKPLFAVAATFESLDAERTSIVFRMIFDTPEACDKIRAFAGEKNEENFDRLEEELKKMQAQDRT